LGVLDFHLKAWKGGNGEKRRKISLVGGIPPNYLTVSFETWYNGRNGTENRYNWK